MSVKRRGDNRPAKPNVDESDRDQSNNEKTSEDEHNEFPIFERYCLVNKRKVPIWINDNEFLHEYHRPIMPNFRSCISSIFRVHAETGNIWTHFIGFVLFVVAVIGFYCALSPNRHDLIHKTENFFHTLTSNMMFWNPTFWSLPDRLLDNMNSLKHDYKEMASVMSFGEHLVVATFFLSGAACLAFSTVYHAFLCYSEKTQKILAILDYIGIVILQIGSCGPPYYYGFRCTPALQIFYLGVIYVLGLIIMYCILFAKLSRKRRSYMFLAYGLVVATPAIHCIMVDGLELAVKQIRLDLLLIMGLLYIAGMLIYTYKIPERYIPLYCNLWFQSHQIFHVMVVAALFVHLRSTYLVVHERLAGGFQCPPGR